MRSQTYGHEYTLEKANRMCLTLLASIFCNLYFAQRRPNAPHHHIPSQLWSKHAEEDDPSLKEGWGTR
eukprot:11396-Heterococcus_DN1.PRE.1